MANFAAPPVEVPPITIGIERPSEDFIRNSTRRVELSVSGGKRLERLDKLHEAMKISLGGLYPCPEVVQAILAPVAGETKRVLDIGCGSRIWSVEMAREFPHVEVLGLDVPQAIEHWKGEYPKNARFEATNFQFAMPEKYLNRFDIIHLRFIASAFSQFQKSLEEIQDCLKPGGLLILVDSTGLIMGEDKVSVPRMRSSSNPNGSQLQRLFYEIRNANASLGLDEFAMRATLEEGLWDNTQLDECGAAEVLVPIGGWVQATDPVVERNLRKAGRLMGQNLEHIQHSHHHMLQNLGFPTGLSREWKKIAAAEINDPNRKTLLDVRVLWGRRRAGDDLPAPPLPIPSTGSEEGDRTPRPPAPAQQNRFTSPFYRVCRTHREWQRISEVRQNANGWIPEPTPFVFRRHH